MCVCSHMHVTARLGATACIMSSSQHTHTHNRKHTRSCHTQRETAFILFCFFFNFAAMATTICLRTLITKSAQWVVIRLWDYPIHAEKSNRPGPNQREIHAHTHTANPCVRMCTLVHASLCVRACV